MVLQYSNQETSVTIGESVRDEDGTDLLRTLLFILIPLIHIPLLQELLLILSSSIRPPVNRPWRHQ